MGAGNSKELVDIMNETVHMEEDANAQLPPPPPQQDEALEEVLEECVVIHHMDATSEKETPAIANDMSRKRWWEFWALAQKENKDGQTPSFEYSEEAYLLWKELPFHRLLHSDFEICTINWSEPTLIIKNGVKEYTKGKKVLDGLNLTISTGAIHVICGPSGSGKTTLVNLCAGLSTLTSGTISVLGSKPGPRLPDRFTKNVIGLMPQHYALYKGYTAYECLHCYGRIYGMTWIDTERRIQELAIIVEMKNLNKRVENYSGGQQRRLSFMIALLHEPKFVVLDEPTVGLDSILRKRIWDYLAQCAFNTGMSILISTHYINEARRANKMHVLRNGKVSLEGTYQQLKEMFNTELLSDGIAEYFRTEGQGIHALGEVNLAFVTSDEETGADLTTQEGVLLSENDHEHDEDINLQLFKNLDVGSSVENEHGTKIMSLPELQNTSRAPITAENNLEESEQVLQQTSSNIAGIQIEAISEECCDPTEVMDSQTDSSLQVEEALDEAISQIIDGNDGQTEAAGTNKEEGFENGDIKQEKKVTFCEANRLRRRRNRRDRDLAHNGRAVPSTNVTVTTTDTHSTARLLDRNSCNRISALFKKNLIRLFRSPVFFIFTLIIPCIEIASLSISFGSYPTSIKVGCFNSELVEKNMTKCPYIPEDECSNELLSCKLLQQFTNDSLEIKYFNSEERLNSEIKASKLKAYFKFSANFSSYLRDWFLFAGDLNQAEKTMSHVLLGMDEMDQAYSLFVRSEVIVAAKTFMRKHLLACHYPYRQYMHPFTNYVYVLGSEKTTFKDFTSTSLLIAVLFFFPLLSSCIWMIEEKADGTFNRAKSAGVTIMEYYLAQTLSETFVILLQTTTTIGMLRVLFEREIVGSIWLICVLCVLVGITGLSMGYFVNLLCNNIMSAIYLAVGTFFPTLAISGSVWPLSALPRYLYYFVYISPLALPAESIRSIVNRGWGFTHPRVWPGFLILVAWNFFFCAVAVFFHRRAKH